MSTISSSNEVFSLSPPRKILIYGGAAFFLLVPLLLFAGYIISTDQALLTAAIIVACIMLPAFVFMVYVARTPKLKLDPSGVELRGLLGYSNIKVDWQQIKSIRVVPGSEGLILKDQSQNKTLKRLSNWAGLSYRGSKFYDREQEILISEQRFVPLQGFGYWFENGNLLNAIREFAPNLVVDFEARRREAFEAAKTGKKVVVIVSLLTLMVLVTAVAFAILQPEISPESQRKLEQFGNAFEKGLTWFLVLLFLLHSVLNFNSAYRFAKRRKFGVAIFWFLLALIQVAFCILVLGSL